MKKRHKPPPLHRRLRRPINRIEPTKLQAATLEAEKRGLSVSKIEVEAFHLNLEMWRRIYWACKHYGIDPKAPDAVPWKLLVSLLQDKFSGFQILPPGRKSAAGAPRKRTPAHDRAWRRDIDRRRNTGLTLEKAFEDYKRETGDDSEISTLVRRYRSIRR